MEHYISKPEKPIDLNQVRYDLAMIYTKEKFNQFMTNVKEHDKYVTQNPKVSKEQMEISRLQEIFRDAIYCLQNQRDNMDLALYDFTYSPEDELTN